MSRPSKCITLMKSYPNVERMIFIRYFRAGLGRDYQQWGEPASPLCTTS